MRYWNVIPVLLAVASLLAIVATHRPNRSRPSEHLASIGASFPHLALAPLAGTQPLTDADLHAGHPTLINLFASWCVPCRVEAPQLTALHAEGIAIAGIAVRDAPADTAAFLAKTGTRFDRVGLDQHERIQTALASAGIPETWLVDGSGVVRARFRGDLHAADLPRVRELVAAAASPPIH